MKLVYSLAIAVFVVVCAVIIPSVSAGNSAGNSGPSANGDFEFILEDGVARTVEFNARTHNNGTTKGEMTFTDPVGNADPEQATSGPAVVKASFDCLVIKDNKAVMSGVISEATDPQVIGHRVLLVVEDNGEGINAVATDKLTWGVYELQNRNWIPSDAEIPGDTGFLLDWIAKDFEREDDLGIPARKSEVIGCQTFSISSYSFTDVRHGQGNIQIRP